MSVEAVQLWARLVCKLVTAIVIALMIYYCTISGKIYLIMLESGRAEEIGLPDPYQAFIVPFGFALALHVFKCTVKQASRPLVAHICKDKDDKEKHEKRIESAVNYVYKLIFYTVSAAWGYIIMKDSPVMPQELGGKGSMAGIFEGMPYQAKQPWFLEYSLFNLGYFLEDFINHVFFKDRHSDFWEMMMHHLVTISLYWGMIMQNFIRIGVIVSWVHQFSDITTAISRLLSQTNQKVPLVISFVICIAHWMWMRNYWLPILSYEAYLRVQYPPDLKDYQAAPDIMKLFLFILCILHVYWCCLFINILYGGLTKGQTENLQSMNTTMKKETKKAQ